MISLLRITLSCLSCLFLFADIQSQSNQYLDFDGVNDRIMVYDASKLIANSSEMSIAGWFYNNQLGYGQGMLGFRRNGEGFYLLQLGNGQIECRFQNNGNTFDIVAPNNSFVPQTWQHFAFTYGNNQLNFYIDGVLAGTKAASGTITDTTLSFGIGTTPIEQYSFFFNGRIDEVSLWKEELSPSQINDMMANELAGNETNLMLYYKFNQGNANQDNTYIHDIYNFATTGKYNGIIENMDLTGPFSNFGGTLDPKFQWIDFPQTPTLTTNGESFELNEESSAFLPVSYSVVSGSATIDGSGVVPGPTAGEVIVSASQAGNGTYDPANTVYREFMLVDASDVDANITPVIPYDNADYTIESLESLRLSTHVNIDYSETFSVEEVSFEIDGESIASRRGEDNYYYAIWTPSSYGSYTLEIHAKDNFGKATIRSVPFNVVQGVSGNTTTVSFDGDHISAAATTHTISHLTEMPCHQGVYDQIIAHLTLSCPPGGCDPWDAIVNIEARGFDGRWIRIIRYITPYGVACSHSIDLTDYASILNGSSEVKITYFSSGNGYKFDLDFEFIMGNPAYNYSYVRTLWNDIYDFGNPADLQSTERIFVTPPDEVKAATLKLIATGHGWGDNNTNNAAEFSHNIHHIHVDGVETFEHDNWLVCNPNPSACSPQNGTWFFDRAGWCPGDIAPYFDYDMTAFIKQDSIQLDYIFDTAYVDLCHANNPNCISGTTCPDCNDGFNPSLHVLSNLVYYSDEPISIPFPVGIETVSPAADIRVYPNPSQGEIFIETGANTNFQITSVFSAHGMEIPVHLNHISMAKTSLNLSHLSAGVYFIGVEVSGVTKFRRVVISR